MEKAAEANPSTKCFSCNILRRWVCAGSLPTHPSDQLSDQKPSETETKVLIKNSSPGIVARLMGLDSFPDTPLEPKSRTLASFLRSRSVNSIDFCLVFDPTKTGHQHNRHRRVKTSISFREGFIMDDYDLVPPLNVIDEASEYQEEFMVEMETRPTLNRCIKDKGVTNNKKRVSENFELKNLEMENRRRRVCVDSPSLRMRNSNKKKGFCGETRRVDSKERRPMRKMAMDSKEALIGPNSVMKKREKKDMIPQKGSRKVHPEISSLETQHSEVVLPSKIVNCDNGEVKAAIRGRNEKKLKNDDSDCFYQRMVSEICKLSAEDLKENWMCGLVLRKFEDYGEIWQELGQGILEILLIEFVHELVNL